MAGPWLQSYEDVGTLDMFVQKVMGNHFWHVVLCKIRHVIVDMTYVFGGVMLGEGMSLGH